MIAHLLTAILLVGSLFGGERAPKYKLAISAIFKNEAPYLKEWIEFHMLQGVEHFFLYNNNSTDEFADVLQNYVAAKKITLIDWPYSYSQGNSSTWLSIQSGAYTHCIKKYGNRAEWLAAIDVDEFLFCPSGETLPSFLKAYKSFGGVAVHWLLFGTSHLETIPHDMLQIEALTCCAPPETSRNRYIKSIVQPKYVKGCKTAHCFTYIDTRSCVDAHGNKVTAELSDHISHDKIRVNHYWTRSESYFREHKILSRNTRRDEENEEHLRLMASTYNDSFDNAILQFIPKLKMALGLSK